MLIYIAEYTQEVQSSLGKFKGFALSPEDLDDEGEEFKLDLKLKEVRDALSKGPVVVTLNNLKGYGELPRIYMKLQSVAGSANSELFVTGTLVPQPHTPLNKALCLPTLYEGGTEEEQAKAYKVAQKRLTSYLKQKGYYTYECELASLNRDCAPFGWRVARAADGFLEVVRSNTDAGERFGTDERASEHVSILQVKCNVGTKEYALAVETGEIVRAHNDKLIELRFKNKK